MPYFQTKPHSFCQVSFESPLKPKNMHRLYQPEMWDFLEKFLSEFSVWLIEASGFKTGGWCESRKQHFVDYPAWRENDMKTTNHPLTQLENNFCSSSCSTTLKWSYINTYSHTHINTFIHSYIYICMVGGFNHLEKYESQWEGLSHILWKIKNVPNHQPGIHI